MMDTVSVFTLQQILEKGFPELGFCISDGYFGENAYEKLTMADGHEKPEWAVIEAKGIELGLLK